jgi:hypothetical protein
MYTVTIENDKSEVRYVCAQDTLDRALVGALISFSFVPHPEQTTEHQVALGREAVRDILSATLDNVERMNSQSYELRAHMSRED